VPHHEHTSDEGEPSAEGGDPKARPHGPTGGGAGPPEVLRPSPEVVALLRQLSLRSLSAGEFDALLGAPVSPQEEAATLELLSWFRRRYPTAAERLAYVRRAYPRWKSWMPRPGGPTLPPTGSQGGLNR
jgi:hypothetical protein